MIKIQNSDAINAIRSAATLSISEGFPQELDTRVQPVMDMTPINNIYTEILGATSRSTTGSSAVLSADEDNFYYITGIQFCATADASCDCTDFWVGGLVNNVSYRFINFIRTTLTAFNQSETLYFNKPFKIKVATGATISLNQTFTVGTCSSRVIIYGYKRT